MWSPTSETLDAEATGERCAEAELYRLRAELLRLQGQDGQAEAGLQRSLGIAHRQHGRWWELRATLTLCRLWRDQGKQEVARRMLAELYGRFREGFDTTDLLEAKDLLEELAE